jgi:hypothetical protein
LIIVQRELVLTRFDPRFGRLGWLVAAWLGGATAFLLLRPLIGLAHELLVVALATCLRAAAGAPFWPELISRLPLDPVYTLALVRFAGEIEARGVAVAGPVGGMLHALLPGLFAAPELVAGQWASALVEPGATVVARGLVGFVANLATLAVGLALFVIGWRRRRPWLAICGALQQAHVVLYQFLDAGLSLRDLEAAGLPFALSTLQSDYAHRAPWFTNELAGFPEPLVSLAAGLLAAGLAYLLLGVILVAGVTGVMLGRRLRGRGWTLGAPLAVRARTAATLGLGVLGLALTPLGAFALAETQVLDPEAPAGGPVVAAPSFVRALAEASGPTPVRIVGSNYRYTLLVDEQPTVIRGMGYNAQYAALSAEERAHRYDRDFGLMRQSGVNSLFGWFPEVFPHQALDKAYEHGLGVAMPYELNHDLPYDDPAFRERQTAEVLAWVAANKDHPAVWFWSPGNEVIHRLIFPSWLKKTHDPTREARADAFARHYVELIDRIHEVDPNHPIVYRDAEEVYLERIRRELRRNPKPRPWLFYGANVYSSRLPEVLAGWPSQGLDMPLFLSEFSPGGTGPADRPRGLRSMWAAIRSYPEYVVGGAVYVWTTDGPEELDRVFGLVDGEGRPRDGSLDAVASFYRTDSAGS